MQSPHLRRPCKAPYYLAKQRGAVARTLLYFFALAVLICAVAGATYGVALRTGVKHGNTPTATQPHIPQFIELDPFTVSVSDTYAERILHVGLTLKVSNDTGRNQITQHLPEIRSDLLVLLSEQDPNALQSAQAKRALANTVRESLNARTTDGHVLDVLFHAFVVQ